MIEIKGINRNVVVFISSILSIEYQKRFLKYIVKIRDMEEVEISKREYERLKDIIVD